MNTEVETLLGLIEKNKNKLKDNDYKQMLETLSKLNNDSNDTKSCRLKLLLVKPWIEADDDGDDVIPIGSTNQFITLDLYLTSVTINILKDCLYDSFISCYHRITNKKDKAILEAIEAMKNNSIKEYDTITIDGEIKGIRLDNSLIIINIVEY